MHMTHSFLAATFVAGTAFLFAAAPVGGDQKEHKHSAASIGHAAPEFTLTGVDGKTYNLSNYKGNTVILEWFSPSCPYSGGGADSYWGNGSASKTLAAVKAADPTAVYLTINSTKDGFQDKTTAVEGTDSAAVITKCGQTVPVLMDADGKVGKAYGAKTTPHIFIVDGTGNVVYIGAPMSEDGKTNYIVNAVTAIKGGKPVEPATTKNKGCNIKFASAKDATKDAPKGATKDAPKGTTKGAG